MPAFIVFNQILKQLTESTGPPTWHLGSHVHTAEPWRSAAADQWIRNTASVLCGRLKIGTQTKPHWGQDLHIYSENQWEGAQSAYTHTWNRSSASWRIGRLKKKRKTSPKLTSIKTVKCQQKNNNLALIHNTKHYCHSIVRPPEDLITFISVSLKPQGGCFGMSYCVQRCPALRGKSNQLMCPLLQQITGTIKKRTYINNMNKKLVLK